MNVALGTPASPDLAASPSHGGHGAAAPARAAETPQQLELLTMSRANWLWLVPLDSTRHALEVAPPGSPLPGALGGHFDRVDRASLSAPLPLAGSDGSLDCVVLHESGSLLATPAGSALLRECHRLLRPGGWLVAGDANPTSLTELRRSPLRWGARIASEAAGAGGGAARACRRAGFAEVRRFAVWPSLAAPRMIIPWTRQAAAAHERLESKHSSRGALRARLARLGLHGALYPVELVLCRR